MQFAVEKEKIGEADPATVIEIVERDPELIVPGQWSPRLKCQVYQSVKYMDQIFNIGDHVMLHTGGEIDHEELVCVIDILYKCPSTSAPMFKGRWFWTPHDVRNNQPDGGDCMRVSRSEAHELICSDQRDINLVEVISRRCFILNWPSFRKAHHIVNRSDRDSKKIFFCDRMYYHKAFKVCELVPELFPGDSMPSNILTAKVHILPDKLNFPIESEMEEKGKLLGHLVPELKNSEPRAEADAVFMQVYRIKGTGCAVERMRSAEREIGGPDKALQPQKIENIIRDGYNILETVQLNINASAIDADLLHNENKINITARII